MNETNVTQEWIIWFTKEWLEMQKLFANIIILEEEYEYRNRQI